MNEAFPRCAVPGSSCRLLQLEAPGARPVWAVLDAAGTRHFTGEITMHVVPTVRAWFNGGELYYAAREGDAPLADRLVEMGVLTPEDLAAGSVQLGAVTHLGRLFDRVPDLDRDRVELALEILTGEVVGEIADHVVEDITVASYRHHPSGVVKWQKRPTVVISQVTATDEAVVPSAPAAAVAAVAPAGHPAPSHAPELVPTPEDEAIVAEFEASLAVETAPVPASHESAVDVSEAVEPIDDVHVTETVEAIEAIEAIETVETVEAEVGEPTLEQPAYDEPFLEQSSVEAPSVEAPSFEPPASEQPAFGAPVFEQPVFEQPALDQPEFEQPVVDQPVVEAPAFAELTDAPAADASVALPFDLSFGDLRAELEAELRAQFGEAPTEASFEAATEAAFETPLDGTPVAVVEPSEPAPTEDAIEPSLGAPTDVAWAIDDRIEWQVEQAAPAWQPETWVEERRAAPIVGSSDGAADDAAGDAVGGPVVEFDLQDILEQVRAETGAAPLDDRPEADDDVRAAVRAALAEIEAATRSSGADEIPSILMQAALADTEPGLPASTDSWVQASLGQPDPADRLAAPPAASPVPPVPAVAARPVLPGVLPTLPSEPAADVEADRPADPPSQELPSTGGLRRTISFRKS